MHIGTHTLANLLSTTVVTVPSLTVVVRVRPRCVADPSHAAELNGCGVPARTAADANAGAAADGISVPSEIAAARVGSWTGREKKRERERQTTRAVQTRYGLSRVSRSSRCLTEA